MSTSQASRAQVASEFVFLLGVFFFFLTAFLAAYYVKSLYINAQNIMLDANRLGEEAAGQINIAYLSGPGYQKNYSLPQKIGGLDYDILVLASEGVVEIKVRNQSFLFPIVTEKVNGNFTKGENMLKNVEGVIFIEQ